jgi:hypothetical protein
MEQLVKDWDRVIDELTSGIDLTRAEGRENAYNKCVSYAESHMADDLWCNAFLAHAAGRLGTTQVMRDVVRRIVPLPERAQVHVAFDQHEGVVITGNREGLTYLSELLRVMAGAPLMGEHAHLYWDSAPLCGETYGCVLYLEDDDWFDNYAYDYYSSQEGEPTFSRRDIEADRVMAVQFKYPLACSLDLEPNKVYIVRQVVKRCGDEVWQKPVRDDDSRLWIFSIKDDKSEEIRIGLDLDDPDLNFLTREELSQIMQ